MSFKKNYLWHTMVYYYIYQAIILHKTSNNITSKEWASLLFNKRYVEFSNKESIKRHETQVICKCFLIYKIYRTSYYVNKPIKLHKTTMIYLTCRKNSPTSSGQHWYLGIMLQRYILLTVHFTILDDNNKQESNDNISTLLQYLRACLHSLLGIVC